MLCKDKDVYLTFIILYGFPFTCIFFVVNSRWINSINQSIKIVWGTHDYDAKEG